MQATGRRAALRLLTATLGSAGARAVGGSTRFGLPRLTGTAAVAGSGHAHARMTRLHRTIASTGQALPAIGLGTWITFNVGDDARRRAARSEVLATFMAAGGGLVDSSPMYGSSEAVIGDAWARLGRPAPLFAATKVWTGDTADGPDQIAESARLWGVASFDLLQVHNLLNWEGHLETLQAMKAAGRLGHLGITTSHGRRHDDMESIMISHPLDFIQLTYNPVDREAENRLLPLARERGIAVIANRPFQRGSLLSGLAGKPLPPVASELGCRSWAQLVLKFIVSHPSVTCVIPATSKPAHLQENLDAGLGPQPSPAARRAIVDAINGA